MPSSTTNTKVQVNGKARKMKKELTDTDKQINQDAARSRSPSVAALPPVHVALSPPWRGLGPPQRRHTSSCVPTHLPANIKNTPQHERHSFVSNNTTGTPYGTGTPYKTTTTALSVSRRDLQPLTRVVADAPPPRCIPGGTGTLSGGTRTSQQMVQTRRQRKEGAKHRYARMGYEQDQKRSTRLLLQDERTRRRTVLGQYEAGLDKICGELSNAFVFEQRIDRQTSTAVCGQPLPHHHNHHHNSRLTSRCALTTTYRPARHHHGCSSESQTMERQCKELVNRSSPELSARRDRRTRMHSSSKVPVLQCLAKSDPIVDVYSFLPPVAQRHLRNTCRALLNGFNHAVDMEHFVGMAACLDPHGNIADKVLAADNRDSLFPSDEGPAADWAPVHPHRWCQARSLEGATLVVNVGLVLPLLQEDGGREGAKQSTGSRTKKTGKRNSRIPDRFLQRCTASRIIFLQDNSVEEAGEQWLCVCSHLEMIHFQGFSSLRSVGEGWLARCGRLKSVGFPASSFPQLHDVGSYWLQGNSSLQSVTIENWPALTLVGKNFLQNSRNLQRAAFLHLPQLLVVDSGWLENCKTLNTAVFDDLPSLECVGHGCLGECRTLSLVQFRGVPSLIEVGGVLCHNSFELLQEVDVSESCSEWLLSWREKVQVVSSLRQH